MQIGLLEPHLQPYGGIRRMIEFANRLCRRGHDVTIFLPRGEPLECTWLPTFAAVQPISSGVERELDVLVFNHELQWHLVEQFSGAKRTAFYALHDGLSYGKEGSWETLRLPVDLRLANSTWTADRVEIATGERPEVVLSGVNWNIFHPVAVRKQYPLLCVGDDRWWKGTEVIREAAESLGLTVETYQDKRLAQNAMATEYSSAQVFVVGSYVEGFGQPGVEAIACGVPLVTTDNGGSRDYAIHEETALVVPPRDAAAMADAIHRLRLDPQLGKRLVQQGQELLRQRLDWERNTDHLETLLVQAVKDPEHVTKPARIEVTPPASPELSLIVLAWDQLLYTQRCIQSIRMHTDVDYELIVVDNGSAAEARRYVAQAADFSILNDENLGFSKGMNQGLEAARGNWVAFVNNDTEFPPNWASTLLSSADLSSRPGVLVPAVTAAGNSRTMRHAPGNRIQVLDPFEPPPSAVVYMMPKTVAQRLGGWSEEYPVASGEDLEMAFRVWVNGLDFVYDERVLVEHVSKGTAAVKLRDWRRQWAENREFFLDRWTSEDIELPRLTEINECEFERNLRTARAVAGWMRRYFHSRHVSGTGRVSAAADRFVRRILASPRRRRFLKSLWNAVTPVAPHWVSTRLSLVLASDDRARMDRRRDGSGVPHWMDPGRHSHDSA